MSGVSRTYEWVDAACTIVRTLSHLLFITPGRTQMVASPTSTQSGSLLTQAVKLKRKHTGTHTHYFWEIGAVKILGKPNCPANAYLNNDMLTTAGGEAGTTSNEDVLFGQRATHSMAYQFCTDRLDSQNLVVTDSTRISGTNIHLSDLQRALRLGKRQETPSVSSVPMCTSRHCGHVGPGVSIP
ncbi:unnamed protein product [Protopolystoma xenopodis]|uniref:Uncharacterized protein n=1 Tax=Protopolystoma xenopodis TaxID=117903 RepID=A0A448WXI0_9PLAT|nr:unnamed protein product [Protopolystoma xenopodis]